MSFVVDFAFVCGQPQGYYVAQTCGQPSKDTLLLASSPHPMWSSQRPRAGECAYALYYYTSTHYMLLTFLFLNFDTFS
jgi:hypothetical protein